MDGLEKFFSFILLVSVSMINHPDSIIHKYHLLLIKVCVLLNRGYRVNTFWLWTLYYFLLLVSLFMINHPDSIIHKYHLLPSKVCAKLNRWDMLIILGLLYWLEVDWPRLDLTSSFSVPLKATFLDSLVALLALLDHFAGYTEAFLFYFFDFFSC